MTNLKLLAVIVAISSVFVLNFSNVFVTENFERPVMYKTKAFFMNAAGKYARIGSWLNLDKEPVLFRNFLNFLSSLTNYLQKKDDSVSVENTVFDGINVRIYTPKAIDMTKPQPFMIYYHGGIYIIGSLDGYDQYLNKLSKKANIVVISVDYRMAPENPYPGSADDCIRVTEYVVKNAKMLNLDIERSVLAGDSAGGHATASVTQHFARKGLKIPKLQVLIYPWVETFNFRLPSDMHYHGIAFLSHTKFSLSRYMLWLVDYKGEITEEMENIFTTNSHIFLLEDEQLRNKYKQYLNVDQIPEKYKKGKDYYETHKKLENDMYPTKLDDSNILKRDKKLADMLKVFVSEKSSPGLADPELLKLLPKAYFIVFEWDTLKDQGLIYAERLKQNGVEVEVAFYEDAFHGMIPFIDDNSGYTVSNVALDNLAIYIKNNI